MIAALMLLAAIDVTALFREARQAEQKGDFTTALQKYDQVLAIDAGIAEVWANKGLVLHELDRHKEALAAFEKAASLKPRLLTPQLFIGLERLRFGEPRKAIGPLTAALEIDPGNVQARYALANARSGLGEFSQSIALYRDLLRNPSPPENARYALAVAYLNWSKASARKLVDSGSPYGKILLAEYQSVAGFAEAAEANYKAALKALPQSAEVKAAARHASLALPANDVLAPAIDAFRAGEFEKALEMLSARAAQPGAGRALYWLSLTLRALAGQELLEHVRSAPESWRTHLLLGDLARSSGDSATARAEYEKAAASAPGVASVHLALIQLLADQDPAAALEQARRAVNAIPGDPELNVELGKLLLKQGMSQDAVSHFRRALDADASAASARAGLADAYSRAGDAAKAIQEMERVISSDPDGSWHYQLGMWYRLVGRDEEARKALAVTARVKAGQRAREEARFLAATAAPVPSK